MAQGPARIASGSSAWVDITGKPSTLSGYGITDAQGLDTDLTALAGLSTTGIIARTGAGTASTRTITGTANQVTVTNGDGVSGNPTLALPQNIASTSTPQFAGITLDGSLTIAGSARRILADFSSSTVANRTIFQTSVTNGPTSMMVIPNGTNLNTSIRIFGASDPDNAPWVDIYEDGVYCGLRALKSGTGVAQTLQFGTTNGFALTITQSRQVSLPAYGAGTLVTDSSGNITASSDRRLKDVGAKFTRGLDDVVKIQPRFYTWKPESGMNPEDVNVGFIAQDVLDAIPEAVGSMKTVDTEEDDGTGKKVKKTEREASEFLTLSDRPIIAALVNAVKELKAENEALEARISALELSCQT